MQKFYLTMIWMFAGCLILPAQNGFGESGLDMEMSVTSEDKLNSLTLHFSGGLEEVIEGYVLLPDFLDKIEGEIKPGGFSILDSKINSTILDSKRQRENLAKNKFPGGDLEVMANGFIVSEILTFRIMPEFVNEDDDSLTLFFKYAVYNRVKDGEDYYFNFDFSIKLFYKMIRIPLNETVFFDFTKEHFKGYEISFVFSKTKNSEKKLVFEGNHDYLEEIYKSAQESALYDTNLDLGIEFVRTGSNTQFFGGPAPKGETLLRNQHYHLRDLNLLKDKFSGQIFELPVPVYYAQLLFPFQLYNPEKESLYKKYRTKNEVLNSRYNVFLIPISQTNDTLTVDLFLVYSKLNLNDGIQRWTPIKKRLSFINWSKVQLPKENWSANFSRQGEDYNIYGYSDFERYINEYLFITLETNNYWRK